MEIVDPDPRWPALFAEEAQRLAAALGPALRALEHVGSTAVPGLAAKPVIDVMAAVDALEEADARLPALAALGYGLRPTGMAGRLFLQRPALQRPGLQRPGLQGPAPEDRPAANLHIVTWASWPSRKERRFRDRLRAHPEEAAAYAALKRRLAETFGDDLERYTLAKTALIQEILDRAADEAGRTRESVWEE